MSMASAEERLTQKLLEQMRNEELDAAVTDIVRYLDEPKGGGGGGGGYRKGGGAAGGKGGGMVQTGAPKRYDLVYASQAEAARACAELPTETPSLLLTAFLGYNDRPWAKRGWMVAERHLSRDVMSRALPYPALLQWLTSCPLDKAYSVAEDGRMTCEFEGVGRQVRSGGGHGGAAGSSPPGGRVSVSGSQAAGSLGGCVGGGGVGGGLLSARKSVPQQIHDGTFTYPRERARVVSLYASQARRIGAAFEQAEMTREHALLEASKGHGESATIARQELLEHRKRVKETPLAFEPPPDLAGGGNSPRKQKRTSVGSART